MLSVPRATRESDLTVSGIRREVEEPAARHVRKAAMCTTRLACASRRGHGLRSALRLGRPFTRGCAFAPCPLAIIVHPATDNSVITWTLRLVPDLGIEPDPPRLPGRLEHLSQLSYVPVLMSHGGEHGGEGPRSVPPCLLERITNWSPN